MAYIYLLTNESMPNVVKVGYTDRSVEERAIELHSTGVPTPFIIFAFWEVPECKVQNVENDLHGSLSKYRIANNREFFKADPHKIKDFISTFIGNYSQFEEDRRIIATRKNIERLKNEKLEEEYKREKDQIYSAYYALGKKSYEIQRQSFNQAEKNIGHSEYDLSFQIKLKYQKIHPLISLPATIATLGIFPSIMNEVASRSKETEEQKVAKENLIKLNEEKINCLIANIIGHFNEYGLECSAKYYSHSYYTRFNFKRHYIELNLSSRFGIEKFDSYKHIFRK